MPFCVLLGGLAVNLTNNPTKKKSSKEQMSRKKTEKGYMQTQIDTK